MPTIRSNRWSSLSARDLGGDVEVTRSDTLHYRRAHDSCAQLNGPTQPEGDRTGAADRIAKPGEIIVQFRRPGDRAVE